MSKQIIGGIFLCILISILILNGTKTGQVITETGKAVTGFARAVNGQG